MLGVWGIEAIGPRPVWPAGPHCPNKGRRGRSENKAAMWRAVMPLFPDTRPPAARLCRLFQDGSHCLGECLGGWGWGCEEGGGGGVGTACLA